MKNQLLALASFCILLSSCATVFTGTKDRIAFNSTPSGAIVYIDGIEQCKTPCSVKVKRGLDDKDVEIKLDGYETRIFELDKEFNIVSVLNLGNLLGWGIDVLSGAVFKYDRKTYDFTLTKSNKTSNIYPSRINIDTNKNTVELYVFKNN
jgi:hypothetical protein